MRILVACISVVAIGGIRAEAPKSARVKELLTSEHYTTAWGTVPVYDAESSLEVSRGAGHRGSLGWVRFVPGKAGVDVLSLEFQRDHQPYDSKWAPDNSKVTVKRAKMKRDDYAAFLGDVAVVESALLKPVPMTGAISSSGSFWVNIRLTTAEKPRWDANWSGYWGSREEIEFAKLQAVVTLSQETLKDLELRDHTLTEVERAWASAKFNRDWKTFREKPFHWWVRERSIEMIGLTGDKSALPTLRAILETALPKEDSISEARCQYYAINAVTRLTGKDVREKPIENLDLETTRRKVLELLR
jgi:hypothetical protein